MSNESRASQWLSSNLAAIGSAAVLTVYAAGYARTKPAADLLAQESERRRPNARPTPVTSSGQVGQEVARQAAAIEAAPAATPAIAPTTVASAPVSSPSPKAEQTVTVSSAPAKTGAPIATALAAATNTSVPTTATASAASVGTPPAPTPTTTASAAPVQSAPAPAPAPAAAAPALAATADTAAPRVGYKDGMFAGWGTSRHGDIQAYVEIKGGKITSAFISECLTQYSCSWIAKLPSQVVERQSAEIDYVSGATQSSNALYYAVVDALKKAK